jgi:hypothetical protein
MKILKRSTVLFVLVSILVGCPAPETLIRSTVLLVLVSTLIVCVQAYTGANPYPYLPTSATPTKTLLLATDRG